MVPNMLKNHSFRGFAICLFVTLLVLALYAFNGLDSLELKSVDFRFQKRGSRPVNKDIVVVAIDEQSIAQLGRWPWPRSYHAKVIDELKAAGAKSVAFDVLFTEKDEQHPESDAQLAKSAGDSGIMTSAFFFSGSMEHHLLGKDPMFPFESLRENSYLGFVNFIPDRDGVSRRGHLFSIVGDEVYPSLPVAALAAAQKVTFQDLLPSLPVVVSNNPLLAENQLFINYAYSPHEESYKTYSFVDVVERKINTVQAFKDKIVFVGGTAAALFDIKAIPYVPIYPGVLIHANIVDNLLTKNYMHETSTHGAALYILVVGLLMGFLLTRFSPWVKLVFFTFMMGSHLALCLWFFSHSNLILPMVGPLLVMVGSYGGVLIYRLFVEEKEKRKIKGSFRQYLSPKIIDILTKDPSKLQLGGEEREVSIFFLDIAGFTSMSEALKPTQLVEVMNHCLNEFSKVIHQHDGLINKYIGDCIMAFWNAPVDQPNHATQACLAALDCLKALPEINRQFQEKGLPSIDCRVGINTGTVVVGNMGSIEKFDYTVMGDAVNLASRLEGANKQYHTHIMVSDVTFEKARDHIEARDLDLIRVKGKKEPRKVFEVLCKKGELLEEIAEGRKRYHQGLALYRQRHFSEAIEAFESVFDYQPNDHVTRVYLERARSFVAHPPPPQWDGSYEMTTK
ncbi:MAG: hypothetical protein KCHDKBKB_01741 [Elusimicrobia bacterium]|nr:hypothetical protein [Elusimicrobiota bacterium]